MNEDLIQEVNEAMKKIPSDIKGTIDGIISLSLKAFNFMAKKDMLLPFYHSLDDLLEKKILGVACERVQEIEIKKIYEREVMKGQQQGGKLN